MASGRAVGLIGAGAAAAVGSRLVGRAMVARTERRLCPTVHPPPYAASAARTRAPSTASRRRPACRLVALGSGPAPTGRPGPGRRPATGRGQRLRSRSSPHRPRCHATRTWSRTTIAATTSRRLAIAGRLAATDLAQPARARRASRLPGRGPRARLRWAVFADPLTTAIWRSTSNVARPTPGSPPACSRSRAPMRSRTTRPTSTSWSGPGYRMMSMSHLFDSEFGGSAHGVAKGGADTRPAASSSNGWRPGA